MKGERGGGGRWYAEKNFEVAAEKTSAVAAVEYNGKCGGQFHALHLCVIRFV